MGIAGKNPEGMRKYRRFVGNPKETAVEEGGLGVRNALSPQFFGGPCEASTDCFARLDKRGTNVAVTGLSRDVALPWGFPADSE